MISKASVCQMLERKLVLAQLTCTDRFLLGKLVVDFDGKMSSTKYFQREKVLAKESLCLMVV